jgi:hypothetical protein
MRYNRFMIRVKKSNMGYCEVLSLNSHGGTEINFKPEITRIQTIVP